MRTFAVNTKNGTMMQTFTASFFKVKKTGLCFYEPQIAIKGFILKYRCFAIIKEWSEVYPAPAEKTEGEE
jgi:hypothetical protein